MTSYDQDLAVGIAQHLAAAGHGTWNPDGAYTPSQTGIVLDFLPDNPPAAISLTPYGVTDDPSQTSNVTGLQIRCRADGRDPRPSRQLGADIFLALHGRTHLILATGLHVVQILRQSAVSGGQDSNGRWSMIQNFYCNLHVPAMHATTEETP